jgi:hypothetical protein
VLFEEASNFSKSCQYDTSVRAKLLGIGAANKTYWKCNFLTWAALAVGRDRVQRRRQKDWQVHNFEDSVFAAAAAVVVVAAVVVEVAAFAATECIQAENL